MCVAKVVQAYDTHPGAAGDALEALRDRMRVDGFAHGVSEHPAPAVDTDGTLLGGLPVPPCREDVDGGRVEVDAPSGVGGLASGLADVVADGDRPRLIEMVAASGS